MSNTRIPLSLYGRVLQCGGVDSLTTLYLPLPERDITSLNSINISGFFWQLVLNPRLKQRKREREREREMTDLDISMPILTFTNDIVLSLP